MEELLPFIFFIAWLLIGGLGSKKKREQMRERAEAERAAREAQARARAEQRRATRESREADGRITYPEEQRRDEAAVSAADMVPDELWAILTGGAPRPGRPQPVPEPEPESYDDEAIEDEWRSATPEEGGWVTSPPWDEEDAVDSIEGVSAERRVDEVVDYDDQADRIARARYEGLRARSWDDQPTSRDAMAIRRSETSDARHYEFHDRLREGEIGAATSARRITPAQRLGLGSMSDVRRAIVLAEILGRPKSLQ